MKLNWGKSLVIFFAIFFSLATAFIIFAFNNTNDLVTDDYYEQGANYTETIYLKSRSLQYVDSLKLYAYNNSIIATTNSLNIKEADSMKIHFYCGANRKNDKFFNVSFGSDSLIFNKDQFEKSSYKMLLSWYKDSIQYLIEKPIQIK